MSINRLYNLIEVIKDGLPIDQAVTDYGNVTLKARGRKLWACCPLHDEKTPSLMVDKAKAKAHCFGCGFDGDSIDFVAAALRISLKDAIRYLAEQLGLSAAGVDPKEVRRRLTQTREKQQARQATLERERTAFKVACSLLYECYEVTHYTGPLEGREVFLENDQLWKALELQNWLDQITDLLIHGSDQEKSQAVGEVLEYAAKGQ